MNEKTLAVKKCPWTRQECMGAECELWDTVDKQCVAWSLINTLWELKKEE